MNPNSEQIHVIELLRVSTEEQAGEDRGGIDAQKAANLRTAARYHLKILRTVEMPGVSGAEVLQEPKFLKLLEDIGRPEIGGVVTSALDRLMRPHNWTDYAILQRFADTNTKLYTESEGETDFNTDAGRLQGGINAIISGAERRRISKRCMDGQEAMRKRGEWPYNSDLLPCGVGYYRPTKEDAKAGARPYFFYKPEAAKVKEIFERFLAGQTSYEVLAQHVGVLKQHYRAKYEGCATAIKYLLQNPLFNGRLVFYSKRDQKTYDNRVINPPLISDSDFARVQVLVEKKQALHAKQRTRIGEYTYTGFIWCARCGGRIYGCRNQFGGYYYVCEAKRERLTNAAGERICSSRYMQRDRLEAILDDLVSNTLSDHKLVGRIYDSHRKLLESQAPKLDKKKLEKELSTLSAERSRIIDLEFIAEAKLTKEQLAEKLRRQDQKTREVEEKLAQVNPIPSWTTMRLVKLFEPFTDWENLDRAAKRVILRGLMPMFDIADYEVHGVRLALLENSAPNTGYMGELLNRSMPLPT